MKLIDCLSNIKKLKSPLFETRDVALVLNIKSVHASKILERLLKAGFVSRLKRSKWILTTQIDPLSIAAHLTSPCPSYVSLYSALYYHGIISQIPSQIYCITLARTHKLKTPMGVFTFHHVTPELFFDFEISHDGIAMASAEKSLVDYFYLYSAKSRLFRALPELTFSENFSLKKVMKIVSKIPDVKRRKSVKKLVEKYFP